MTAFILQFEEHGIMQVCFGDSYLGYFFPISLPVHLLKNLSYKT